jgi:hypothetical protein
VRTLVSRGPGLPAARDALERGWSNDTYTLYQAREEYGYFDFVRAHVAINGDPTELRALTRQLVGPLYEHDIVALYNAVDTRYQASPVGDSQVALTGPGTLHRVVPVHRVVAEVAREPAPREAARVLAESTALNTFRAEVEGVEGEHLLVKASYHPYWHAYVDDREVSIAHAVPNLMVIDVPPGHNEVVLRYRNPLYQKILFLLSLLAVITWLSAPVIVRKRRHRRLGSAH